MDSQIEEASTQPQISTPPTPQSTKNPFNKVKAAWNHFSKRQKIIGGLLLLLLIVGIIFFLITPHDKNIISKDHSKVYISTVNGTKIPQSYLDIELKYYPAASGAAETKKFLTDKLVNDEITLQYGQKQGWIKEIFNKDSPSDGEYLTRTEAVKSIRQKIEQSAKEITGTLVSIWFYNSGYVGPDGLAKGKETAYKKIKPLYDKVKSKELSIVEAGKLIAADPSLKVIDPAFEANALSTFTSRGKKAITFWPEFDKLLRQAKVGEITPLYLGHTTDKPTGKVVDELYVFGQVDEILPSQDYSSYDQWIKIQRQNTQITYRESNFSKLFKLGKKLINPLVLADDDGGSNSGGGNDGGGGSEVNESIHGAPYFEGTIYSVTGAPVVAATVSFANASQGHEYMYLNPSFSADTNGIGFYHREPMGEISCLSNPHVMRIYHSAPETLSDGNEGLIGKLFNYLRINQIIPTVKAASPVLCGEDSGWSVANVTQTRTINGVCVPPGVSPPTTLTPPPAPACGQACTTPADCNGAQNNCTSCIAGTCQTPPPAPPAPTPNPPPPACGSICTTRANCDGNRDGCVECLTDPSNPAQKICRQQPACGTACTNSYGCQDSKDGCINCITGVSGAKCGACPAGMIYDAQTFSCKCPNPNETNPHGVCDGDKCTQVGSCGVTECTTDKQCFAEEMCKCDGFEATKLEYPSANPFEFQAFAKIEGTDVTKATVEGIQFKMSESDKSNPNVGTIIAQSPMYSPDLVSSTASKVRFGAKWSLTPPQIKADKMYRVFADIKCVPKKKRQVANAADQNQRQSKVAGLSNTLAQAPKPSPTPDYLQLKTLNFIKKGQTDNCRFLFFSYDQGL